MSIKMLPAGKDRVIRCVYLLLCMTITSCSLGPAQPAGVDQQSVQYADVDGAAWHACRFRMSFEEGDEPDWHIDLALAHVVVGPILEDYRDELVFWRFHRRAAHDKAGHQFSFIFYADSKTSSTLASAIMASSWLTRLQQADVVTWASCRDQGAWQGSEISDSSGKSWSEEIRNAWPLYIMGVSEFWLDMIRQLAAAEATQNAADPESLLAEYKSVNDQLTEQWQQQGRHALLHHLNAVFGYSPLLMRY